MSKPVWLQHLRAFVLGRDQHQQRHVLFALLALLPYLATVGVIQHSEFMGLLNPAMANRLTLVCLVTFVVFFALVRSGWSQRFADPVLTFPHALASISICMAAYVGLGELRANIVILIAQAIVLSMFRLRPRQVLLLGVYAVTMLAACVIGLSITDPVSLPPALGLTHFVVAGSTLLVLSLIGKWVSDIRVRIGRQASELAEAVRTVQQMATTDMLTGALNRRMMTDLAEAELKLSERTGAPMCVALIDIDHFKHINDRFGHHAGDAVLKGMAEHASSQLRQVDKFGRWGGEEFLLMLPRIPLPDAMAALDRLRLSVEALSYPDNPQLRVTFSAGVAQAIAGESLEHLVERADEALYAAKHQGRNRCLPASQTLAAKTPQTDVGEALQP